MARKCVICSRKQEAWSLWSMEYGNDSVVCDVCINKAKPVSKLQDENADLKKINRELLAKNEKLLRENSKQNDIEARLLALEVHAATHGVTHDHYKSVSQVLSELSRGHTGGGDND